MTRDDCIKKCGGYWLLKAEDNETGQDRCLLLRINERGVLRTREIKDIQECYE